MNAKNNSQNVFQPNLKTAKRPFYNLMMFPYPSAEGLHVGNMYAFTGSDIYGRYMKLQGYDLFEPIGLDGFGIHSENYAIRKKTHPAKMAAITKKNFYRQLKSIGNAYAWDNTLETYDPNYYKWTQWIFIQMFNRGLAYQQKAPVNWCPSCKTVLADEQVENGVCERCKTKVVKKDLKQWFFRITKYANRLVSDLAKLDWSEKVKIAQKNWIGKSSGSLIKFKLQATGYKLQTDIDVFTTRPDTLFGATYLVLAPENKIIDNLKLKIKNLDQVTKYIEKSKNKSDLERTELQKDKSGVELKGIRAINPANNEEIPVFVADYVLTTYGTGAIMAVPAHDERDYEFAKKYNLPIVNVIIPSLLDYRNPPQKSKKNTFRKIILAIVYDPQKNKYLCLKWKKQPWVTFITGGIEEGEDIIEAARREITEETGYKNLKFVRLLGEQIESHFYAAHKGVNRKVHDQPIYFELINDERNKIINEERELYDILWLDSEEVINAKLQHAEFDILWNRIKTKNDIYTGNGILVNSEKFNGMGSDKAKEDITKFVGGKLSIQYKLRDWLISRQRYWGPPIPIIHCDKCGAVPVPEKDLPVKLPETENWRPKGTGESPLANIAEFVNTKCPKCGGSAKRETDVSDTFLDSAWYYLGFLAKTANSKFELRNSKFRAMARRWLPVNMYIGGAEHSVLHLLYVRFITYVFKEMGLINFDNPFKKFRAHGLIIKDGAKMSKSRGNVVVPDEYIKKYGSDVLRMYLMFIGPFTEGGDFRDEGIVGIKRFLDKIGFFHKMGDHLRFSNFWQSKESDTEIKNLLNLTIDQVTANIKELKFNTAISSMMIFLNKVYKHPDFDPAKYEELRMITKYDFESFIILLSPFAPDTCEKLWMKLGHSRSVFSEKWPKAKKIEKTVMFIPVMINGKKRALLEVETAKKLLEKEMIALAQSDESVKKWLVGKKIKKTIYIPGKIINIVL